MSAGRGGTVTLLGAVGGVVLALALRKPPAETQAAAEPRATNVPVTASTTTALAATAPAVTSSSVTAASSSAAVSARSDGPPSVRAVPPPPAVADLAELKTAEIRCYQKDADACLRAADAYAAGKLVPADAARAENYRKVELTQLFRQCEKASVRACLVLAERYGAGQGLAADPKKAKTLVTHVGELCARRPVPECELLRAPTK